jgi:hypothetical protein
MFDRSQIQKGADIYGANGNKIGTVSEIGPDYLQVAHGFLDLAHDLYVPFTAVRNVEDNGRRVNLDVTKDQINHMGWNHKPSSTVGAGPTSQGTMYGTSPSSTAPTSGPVEVPITTPGDTTQGTNQWTQGTTCRPQDLKGHKVLGMNGQEIGHISGVGPDYFEVSHGILGLGSPLYVPFGAVSYCNQHSCYLSVSKDQVQNQNWSAPPTRSGQAAGYGAGGNYPIPYRNE